MAGKKTTPTPTKAARAAAPASAVAVASADASADAAPAAQEAAALAQAAQAGQDAQAGEAASQATADAIGAAHAASGDVTPNAALQTEGEPARREYIAHALDIRHDGKLYRVGQRLQLTADEASRLQGWVVPAPADGVVG